MEDDQWHDPLLITDVSWQKELNSHSHYPSITSPSSQTSIMEDPDDIHFNANNDVSWQNRSLEVDNSEKFGDQTPNSDLDGRSMLGFSLTSPDLVICAGSPDIPRSSYEVSPRFLKSASIELSLENGINGPKLECKQEFPTDEEFLDASWELLPVPMIEDKVSQKSIPVVSINSGSLDGVTALGGTDFVEDSCFTGGDIIRTATKVGDGEAIGLYQIARSGNFSYRFKTLERGIYFVDLHLAEIVFTDGHPGMRVFNVYIQEQKAVSCIDIYARVGANKPLVIPDLKTFVSGGEGLSIRFEGVTGNPLVCGISVRKDVSASFGEVELLKAIEMSQIPECEISKDCGNCEVEGEFQNLPEEYERQRKELTNTRRALEELKRENECKSRECQEAWKSLKDLQNELMRKSMHVGSLAFAIEGQVKEKGKWFSSLRDLKRKLKLLKMDQIKLSEEALSYKKCLVDMNDMCSIIQYKLNQQVELHEDLKLKFIKGAKERKEFYNKILELKGNIRVFCRCRPLNTEETTEGVSMAIDFEAARDGELTVKSNGAPKKTFKFDAVFGPQSNQVDVFEDTAPFATSVLDGYNVCIFAYGQTGTGKTFTMEGTNEARGVNFRTLEELFHIIKERRGQFQYEISVSVLEVYNEQIRDLLVSGTQPGAAKRLEIRYVGEGIHHVPGLAEAHVSNMNEAWEVLQTGSNSRAVGSTNANEHSSRSHCIHCVMVKGENLLNGECTRSKLWLVDLAGSERVARTEVQGERLKETQNINRSLSALGDVISALATKSPHIPFRNSKLTHLLQDSLGGDSKTLMFVQISPNENDLSETLCSLNFASRVRGIELGPTKKQVESTELLKYKLLAEKTKLELKSKDVQIKKLEDTINGLDWKMKEKDLKNKNFQDKIKELESQLLIERRLARQHVDLKLAEQQQQQQQMRQQQQEEQNSAFSRPPLPSRPLQKNFNEGKELVLNHTRPFSELNGYKLPSLDSIDKDKNSDPMEKENNPEMAEPPLGAKQTGRASLCPILQWIPAATAPRRNSLIPLPSAPGLAKFPQPLLPLPPIQDSKKEEREDGVEYKGCLKPVPWDSPKEHKSGGGKNTKVSSILRRSLQRRVQIRSPMQQHMRRGGINVGMEKVRVSIGSRGRVAHRVLLGNTRRPMKDGQQKESQREKERGWNIGTAGRII